MNMSTNLREIDVVILYIGTPGKYEKAINLLKSDTLV